MMTTRDRSAIAVWSGCAGRVDLEKPYFPSMADADWELRDDNFDGRCERKVVYGYAVTESPVDLPVPTKVRLEPKP